MRKLTSLFLLLFIFSVFPVAAQVVGHHVPPPQHYKPKKKDTIRVNPYLVDTLISPIPMSRSYFHDKIAKEQQKADASDGITDNKVRVPHDSALTAILTRALFTDVGRIQIMIENMPANGLDPVMENQQKIRGLTAVWELLRQYNNDPKPEALFYKKLVANMHDLLIASNENRLMEFARAHTDIYTLDNGKVMFDSHPEVRAYIYTAIGKEYPVMMIKRLTEYANDSFAPAIITVAARLVPDVIFNYATSTNTLLKSAVYRTPDSLVQAIVRIATYSHAPLKALPLLPDVYYGRKTVAEIDEITERPDIYFENLVRLKLENDTIGRHLYTAELQYNALKYFVRQMNELHESKDDVRFHCIDSLPPSSLYFLMVYGQDEIYTSTFLGTFRRMMERMKPMKGDEFLSSMHYSHFRTFIRMCAGYNTLTSFLGSIDDTSKSKLMASFVSGLEKGSADDLEDAVDVADAFGSIRDSSLSAFLQKKVKTDYEISYKQGNKKGLIVYSLLAMLFESNKISGNDTGAAVTSARLHLPLINKVPFKALVDDSGIVYQQVFFFGDDDGKNSYDSYMDNFKKNPKWTVTTEKYWSVISSTEGKRIVIYANLPLKEPEDEVAQDSLAKYLDNTGIHPTIVIHRGHSYHLPFTLARLNRNVRIVILGSCGGYHNLALVLDRAPDAHIVSSKQTGAMAINEPIIKSLNAMLLEGADINWISMWRELDEYFLKRKDLQEKYDDYVPPYKNLGAIFIKAYRQVMKNP